MLIQQNINMKFTKENCANVIACDENIKHDINKIISFMSKSHSILYDLQKNNYEKYYNVFDIPKKQGGTRTIYSASDDIQSISRKVLFAMQDLDKLEMSLISILGEECYKTIYKKYSEKQDIPLACNHCIHGYTKNKSIITNATEHKNSLFFFKTDIREAFPSISREQVYYILQKELNERYAVIKTIKEHLIYLYHRNLDSSELEKGIFVCPKCNRFNDKQLYDLSYYLCYSDFLVIGLPSSPYLLNAYLKNFDLKLNQYCLNNNLIYTRYADDIVISGNTPIPNNIRKYVKLLLEDYGLKMNEEKTRKQTFKQKNVVTGIVVSYDKNSQSGSLGIGYRKFNQLKKGLYQISKGKLNNEETMKVQGMLSFLKSVNEERYNYLVKKYNLSK